MAKNILPVLALGGIFLWLTQRKSATGSIPPPVAGFTATPTSGIVPLAVELTDASSGEITGRMWSFGDGTQEADTVNPTHTYMGAATYIVTLAVTGPGGSSQAQLTITTQLTTPGPALVRGSILSVRAAVQGEPYTGDSGILVVSPGDSVAVEVTWRAETKDFVGTPIPWPYYLLAAAGGYVGGVRTLIGLVHAWDPSVQPHAPGTYTTQYPPMVIASDALLQETPLEIVMGASRSDELGVPNPLIADEMHSTYAYSTWTVKVV